MDMKKFLQAVDGASSKKPVEGSNDMKKFLQVMEGRGPLNRLTQAESITVQTYSDKTKDITSPVLNVQVGAKPGMIGKYFKQVEEEIAEAQNRSKSRARQLAEIVTDRINEGVPRLSKHISQSKIPPESLNRRAKKFAGKRLKYSEEIVDFDNSNSLLETELKLINKNNLQIGQMVRFGVWQRPDEHQVGKIVKITPDGQVSINVNGQIVDVYLSSRSLTFYEPTPVKETKHLDDNIDSVTMDIPLLIRLMEFAREDAQSDMDLHRIAEKLIGIGNEGQSLTMSDYDDIVGDTNTP